MKRVLITMGNRNETITEAVCGEYRREGYEVFVLRRILENRSADFLRT